MSRQSAERLIAQSEAALEHPATDEAMKVIKWNELFPVGTTVKSEYFNGTFETCGPAYLEMGRGWLPMVGCADVLLSACRPLGAGEE